MMSPAAIAATAGPTLTAGTGAGVGAGGAGRAPAPAALARHVRLRRLALAGVALRAARGAAG
jgi:hypothetical protein